MLAGVEAVCATVRFGASASSPILGVLPHLVVVDIRSSPSVPGLVRPLFDEAKGGREGRQAALNLLCALVVIEVIRYCVATGSARSGVMAGLGDARLSRALKAVHASPQLDWTLQGMAEEAGMSRARFAVAFRGVVGTTPGEYLQCIRLTSARALLRGGAKLKQVAPQVGYASEGTLARALARHG